MKKKILFLFIIVLVVGLIGCNSQPEIDNKDIAEEQITEEIPDYILTSNNGQVTIFGNDGKVFNKIDYSNGDEDSNFIYAIDEGMEYNKEKYEIYRENKDNKILEEYFYAFNLDKGLIYKTKITKDGIEKDSEIFSAQVDKNLEIIDFKVYRENIFYTVKNTKRIRGVDKATFFKPEKEQMNGVLDYFSTISKKEDAIKTYVYYINTSDRNYSRTRKNEMVYEIPYNVKDIEVNDDFIYFFLDGYMGKLELDKNEIALHYGGYDIKNAIFKDGLNHSLLILDNYGTNLEKSFLYKTDFRDMKINTVLELDGEKALNFSIDNQNDLINIAFRKNEDESTYARIKTLNLNDNSEISSIPVKYVPTKILSHNAYLYLFNPYEEYIMVGDAGSASFRKYKKNFAGDFNYYDDMFLINLNYYDDYKYDNDGNFINNEGQMINANGELIDSETNERINRYGQKLNEYGQAVNNEGQLLDKYGNIIDNYGDIVSYKQQENGYFINSSGEVVNSLGKKLVKTQSGNYVLPQEKILTADNIPYYYDENGKIIIAPDFLEENPDAYKYIREYK